MKPPPSKIVVLDLDGTLIGDVTPILVEYEILNKITTPTYAKTRARQSLIDAMTYGSLLRRGVKAMLGTPGIEFYVYTASETNWAKTVIRAIEQVTNVQVNRPIFTRKDCIVTNTNEIRKDLSYIKNKISRSIKKKHNLKQVNLSNSLLFVDNTPDVLLNQSERDLQITCPTYNRAFIPDILSGLPTKKIVDNAALISNLLQMQSVTIKNLHQFKAMYYYHLMRTNSIHAKDTNDEFFYKLMNAINKTHSFSTANIHVIRRLVKH